jgi:hypothetical protein
VALLIPEVCSIRSSIPSATSWASAATNRFVLCVALGTCCEYTIDTRHAGRVPQDHVEYATVVERVSEESCFPSGPTDSRQTPGILRFVDVAFRHGIDESRFCGALLPDAENEYGVTSFTFTCCSSARTVLWRSLCHWSALFFCRHRYKRFSPM